MQEAENEVFAVSGARAARRKSSKAGLESTAVQGCDMEEVAAIPREPFESKETCLKTNRERLVLRRPSARVKCACLLLSYNEGMCLPTVVM